MSDRYTIAADPVLGDGDLVQVVLAHDRVLDLPVAVKVLRPVWATDSVFRRAFDGAVHAAGRITHPNLLPMHDVGETPDGCPFVAFARAEGGSFAALVGQPPPWSELFGLIHAVLDALAFLHARGLIHRRLKPSNLLLHPDGDGGRRVWVADAGFAAISARAEPPDLTPSRYSAPELRAKTEAEIGPATDLFALGVVLWEVTTGRAPFAAGESPSQGTLPPFEPVVPVPPGLETVLANLLSADPLARYDLAADVRTELDALGVVERGPRSVPSRPPESEVRATPVSVRLAGRPSEQSTPTRAPDRSTATPQGALPNAPPNRDPLSKPLNRPAPREGTVSPGLWVRGRGESHVPADDVSVLGLTDEPPAIPGWNRPFPPPIPAEPPAEVGLGATARASLSLFAAREIPLVGRDAEYRAIWTAAREVAVGRRAKVVVVTGDAGSGRTRLLRSVTRTLEERGHAETVWMAYGDPPTDDDGYAGAARNLLRPWGEPKEAIEARIRRRLLRERTGTPDPRPIDSPTGPDPASATSEIRAEAAALLRWTEVGGQDSSRAGASGVRPAPLSLGLREVFRHLEAHSWRGLACLVLDDARHAVEPGDGLSIAEAFVERADDGMASIPLLVLVSVPTEDLAVDEALRTRIERWVSRGAVRVDLPPLGAAETDALVEEGATLVTELRARVLERCAGNPLVARQLLLGWVDRGALVPNADGPGYALQDPTIQIPSDTAAILHDRLEALAGRSGLARRFVDLVHLLALAGRSVPRGLVDGFAGPELEAFVHGCGLWVAEGDRLVFDSTTVHQHLVAVADARPDASYLHRRLARAWGRFTDERGAAMEAGRHGVLANDAAFGVPWLLRAAEGCWAQDRVGGLARSAQLANEAVDADPALGSLRGPALLWRAHALAARGLGDDATALFVAARDVLVASGDTLLAIDALLGLGWARLHAGDAEAADWLFSDAVSRARQAAASRPEARGIAGKAYTELHKRAFEAADTQFARAVVRSAQLGDIRGAGDALLGQGFVARRTGRFDQAIELYEQARSVFHEGPDPAGEVRAGLGLAAVARQQDPGGACEARYAACADLAQEIGATSLLVEARLGLAHVARHRGDRARAERIYVDCGDWANRSRSAEHAVVAALGRAQLALEAQELGAAYDQTSLAAKWLEKVPGHWLWASYRLVVATLLAHRRDHTHTWQWLWSAQEVGLAEAVDRDNAACLVSICEVAAEARWANVIRLAGKIGAEQLERVGDEAGANRLKQRVATALL